MKKNYFLLLIAIAFISGKSYAQQTIQPCGTDEMHKIYQQKNPQAIVYQTQLDEEIKQYMANQRTVSSHAGRTMAAHADTDWYDIPVAVHVIHNGGNELLPDNDIYNLIAEMNHFYSLNYDTSTVVPEFKKYVGKAKMRFHLAAIDPNGNPTNGITHRRSYITYGYDDQAKIDQWPPTSYVNIWFEYVIGAAISGGIIVAYTTLPPDAAAFPPYDGIISNYQFVNDGGQPSASNTGGGSMDHEMGHEFYLYHTFGTSNNVHTNTSGNCTSDDQVDDTPPTEGNLGGCSLYDTVCATNYYKLYSGYNGLDSLVNYPDTSNEQNIMNYADCKAMFTAGQITRMRATLNSNVAGRNNLWDTTNLIFTGIWDTGYNPIPHKDLKPIPDFVATPPTGNTSNTNYKTRLNYFTCPGTSVGFKNCTWNDTLSHLVWTFSNGAALPTDTSRTTFTNTFANPGWVTLSMIATGNGSGSDTATWTRAIFVADSAGTPAQNVFQSFNQADTAKWPTFNYYNNGFKWQIANTGLWDNNSMEYVGYDDRINTLTGSYPYTAPPNGDVDDFFSVPIDFTSFAAGHCSFNFDYSGASRSSNSLDINDTLEIDYSINKGSSWTKLTVMAKGNLDNKGAVSVPYTPSSATDWSNYAIDVPSAAMTNYTLFRFRYSPNVGLNGYSSGNNFYIDNIRISPFPSVVGNVNMNNVNVTVVPNPTSGDAYVVVKDADNTLAKVVVTDITGRVVYTTSKTIAGNADQIQIPYVAISVPGMYIVQTITGSEAHTQKLVVE